MDLKLTIALLALCALTNAFDLPTSAHQHLSKLLLQSRAAIEDNPTRSILCFGDYLDEITEHTNVYEEELEKCNSDSEEALAALDATFAENREDLSASAASACQLFTDCNAKEKSLDFFNCYSSAGSEASRASYSIASKADQYTKEVGQKQSVIVYAKGQCDSSSKEKYEKSVDSSWTKLQVCINGSPSALTEETKHSKGLLKALRKH